MPSTYQDVVVDADIVHDVLKSFWLPFLNSAVIQQNPTVVALSCARAQPAERWNELVRSFADPCCVHTADLIRVSAISFGVWKVVSRQKKDLNRFAALYNPFSVDMRACFQVRLEKLEKLLATPHSDDEWSHLVTQVNLSIRRRNMSLPWTRCPKPCSITSFENKSVETIPLLSWGLLLQNE